MNKSLYRTVFNETRGQVMAVAENASAHQSGSPGQSEARGETLVATVKSLTFSLWVALGVVAYLPAAHAQIIADRTAPANQRPTVLTTPSGAPLVNIQTPSAAGVSRNTYSQFDVTQQGAVLNNSRTGAVSQVGGAVGANPWLARGTARVILNEVNSTDPSRLRGVVEVAGDKAQVVIANPSGITCDGCGFINASRATVTTGKPIVTGGHLDGYRVERGTVTVEGKGMDARGADYTDVIARTVKINADVLGKDVKVRQGAALVSADNADARAIKGSGDTPTVGIDVAQLGGMYANKIVLIGGEAGVGVRNAGNLAASAGEVVITADGLLTNTGRITASAHVAIDTSAGIANSGTIYAGTDTGLKTRGNIANTGAGLIASVRHTQLETTGADSKITVDEKAMVAAGLKTTGEGDQAKTEINGNIGDLGLRAEGGVTVRGMVAAAGDLRASAKALDFGHASLSGQNLLFAALDGSFDARAATMLATQSLTVRAQDFNTDGSTLNAGALDVQAQSWSNRGGQVVHTGAGLAKVDVAGKLDNTEGTLASMGSLLLNAGQVDNTRGYIVTNEDQQEGAAPKAAGSGDLTLRADSLDNTAGVITATKGITDVTVASALTNGKDSYIGADGALSVMSMGLVNGGTLRGNGITIDTRGQALDNAGGSIVSDGDITTHSGNFNNEDGLVVGGRLNLDLQGGDFSNRQSDSNHGLIGKSGISLQAGSFDNRGGYVFVGDEGLKVNGTSVKNTDSGTIEGTGGVTVDGSGFDNRGGNVSVAGQVNVQVGAGTIDNTGGLIGSGGAVDLRAGNVVNSNTRTQTQIDAAQAHAAEATQAAAQHGIQGQSVQITATAVANDNGVILANESVTINGSGQLNNTGGTISAGRALRIIDAASSSLEGNRLAITNTGGTLIANESLQINAGRLSTDGKLHSNGDFDLRLNSSIANTGELVAARNMTVVTTGSFTNSGTLSAANALNVSATEINNTSTGEITATSTTLNASEQITNRGLINGEDTALKADTIANIGTGRIYGTRIGLQADTVYNTDESSSASRRTGFFHRPWNASWYQASTQAESATDSGKSGVIAARERLDIGAREVRNFNGAEISSGGEIHFGRSLDANNQATGQAYKVTNSSALIDAGGAVDWSHVDNVVNTRTHIAFKTDSATTHEQTLIFDTGGTGNYRAVRDIQTTANTTTLDEDKSSPAGVIRSDGAMKFGNANIENRASGIYAFGGITYDQARYHALTTKTVETATTASDILFFRDKCKKREIGCGDYKHNRMETRAVEGMASTTVDDYAPDTEIKGNELLSGDPTLYGQRGQGAAALDLAAGASSQAVQVSNGAGGAGSAPSAGGDGASLQKTVEVRVASINLHVPTSSLFSSSDNGRTIVTTDSQFAGYRQWLDSDYLLRELGVDPGSVGRRLGDGYYEQRLIREQTAKLLGSRILDKNENNEREYIILMSNAVDYAKKNNLKVGTALTAEQIANLPSDIVWLEYRDVTLSNGNTAQALVPQVYARTQVQQEAAPGQLGNGIIAANRIDFTVNGDFNNHNALTARDALTIRADNIHNAGGLLQAGNVALAARTDTNNVGGQILGTDGVLLTAGRDINLTSTTRTESFSNAIIQQVSTQVDKLASVSVTGTDGVLAMEAGRNLNLTAAQVRNTGQGGQTSLTAKGDVRLDSVVVNNDLQYAPDAGNFGRHRLAQDVGSMVVASGDVWIKADGNLNAHAAIVSSDKGIASLQAGQDLNLSAGRKEQLDDTGRTHTRDGWYSRVTTVTRDTVEQIASVGTTVSGADVQLKAGRDANLQATQVTATNLLDVNAGRDLNVMAGVVSKVETHDRSRYRSANAYGNRLGHGLNSVGLFDFGYAVMQKSAQDRAANQKQTVAVSSVLNAGTVQLHSGRDTTLQGANVVADENLSVRAERHLSLLPAEQTKEDVTHSSSHAIGQIGSWYQPAMGSVQQNQDARGSSTTLAGTQVMSLHGNVSLQAGEQYTQTASQVAAPEGDVHIVAKQVTINEGEETGQSRQDGKYAKTAIGGSINIPFVTAIQSIHGMVKAGEDTKNDRMKAMAAVNTALAAKEAAGAAMDMMNGGMGGIKVSANLSHNESKNRFEESGSNAVGSLVAAGGNVDIRATGAGADSQLTISGSQIDGGKDVHLLADGAVTLKASENSAHQQSKDSSAGVSLGVGFALGGSQNGFTIDLSASASRGKSNGDDLARNNTHVNAGGTFNVESGGDTTLRGAVVNAQQITGDVKGNLKIESLQDSSTFHSLQESAGFAVSLCIPPICAGMSSVSGNYSQSNIDSNFLAVTEQSGLMAGDGGYQIKVGGDTHLIGGVIASSDKAIAEGKNRFEHGGGVKLEDINNRVEFSGDAFAVSGSVSTEVGDQSNTSDLGHRVSDWNERNIEKQSGNTSGSSGSRSTTVSGQDAGTKPSASFGAGSDSGMRLSVTRSGIGVSTRADTAGLIAPIFNAADVRRELGAQTRITQTFSQVAPKAVAELAKSRMQPREDAAAYNALRKQQAAGERLSPRQERELRQLESRGMNADMAQQLLNDSEARADYARWGEGGVYRVALHTVVGALGGGVDGALGAGTVAAAAPVLDEVQLRVSASLVDAGLSDQAARVASQGLAQLTAAGLGAVAGNTQGAGYGWAVDTNNRQLHPDEKRLLRERYAAAYAKQHAGMTVAEATQILTDQMTRLVDSSAARTIPENQEAMQFVLGIQQQFRGQSVGKDQWGNSVPLFGVAGQYQRNDATIFSAHPQTTNAPGAPSFSSVANWAEGVVGRATNAVMDAPRTLANVATGLWAVATDGSGVLAAGQADSRQIVERAGEGDFKPAGEQVGAVAGTAALVTGLTAGPPRLMSTASAFRAAVAAEEALIRLTKIENNFGTDSGYVPTTVSLYGVPGGVGQLSDYPHPYLYTGHVGYSFDYGQTKFGFGPYATESREMIVANLKSGVSYPGVVRDNVSFFQLAAGFEGEARGGLGAQNVYQLDVPMIRSEFERAVALHKARGMNQPMSDFRYAFDVGPSCTPPFNCATYPSTLGILIPSNSGSVSKYVPAMIRQGASEWRPPYLAK